MDFLERFKSLDPQVVEQQQLRGLDRNGRRCEVCDKHMHDHAWAQLDRDGFVVDCCFVSKERPK